MNQKDEFDKVLDSIRQQFNQMSAEFFMNGDRQPVWCEACQDWFPPNEDGSAHCDCDDDFSLDSTQELDFED